MMLCKGKSRQLSMTYSCQNPRPPGRADEQRQERQSSVCRQSEVFLMYSPSWPWQISVVPVVPSTNTAFLLISFRDGVRGGQCEHIVYSKPETGFMTKHEISTSWCNNRRNKKVLTKESFQNIVEILLISKNAVTGSSFSRVKILVRLVAVLLYCYIFIA